MIDKNTKIEDLVKEESKMMDYFNNKRIDYCCNGFFTIEEVAKEKNIETDKLVSDIKEQFKLFKSSGESKTGIDLEDFKKLNIKPMIDSILKDHHENERELLYSIDKSLNKILIVHFDSHGEELLELHKLFGALKTELEAHFVKEEKITFPLILEHSKPSQEIINQIDDLETEHEKAGDIIKEMIELTDDFTPPADGCNTYRKTFTDLNTLTKDVFIHIFKENSIMFEKYKEF